MSALPEAFVRSGLVLALAVASSCAGGTTSRSDGTSTEATHDDGAGSTRVATGEPETTDDGPPANDGDIPFYEDGQVVARISRETAARRHLTILDLGDSWTAHIFDDDESLGPAGRQPLRRQLIRLANEETRDQRRDPTERYLEVFGISPSIHVMHERFADAERHACHDDVDDTPIEQLTRNLTPGSDRTGQRHRAGAVLVLRRRLQAVVEERGLSEIDDLAEDRRYGSDVARYRRLAPDVQAILSVQEHLRCEGFLNRRARDGVLDPHTAAAIRAWHDKHMIVSLGSRLDEATRQTLAMDSHELDFRSLLRVLRERVVDASGVLEDGTTSLQWGTVIDRQLNIDDEFRWADRLGPMDNGTPDLVSSFTDAAARQLGWVDPERAAAWLAENATERAEHRYVAVRLPEPPDYYSDQMDLRVEIDRGDVYYAFPYTDDGRPRGAAVRRRPTTTIFARRPDGSEVALIRWNTTIGGWQPEVNPEGGVGLRYKESDVGPRVWRDVIAGPAWLPPPSTPDDELLRRTSDGWRVNTEITGPGFQSAYGLAMVIHHQVRNDGSDPDDWRDNGIRSHGSVSYRTILRGYSHGCHRLFNHLAVRMMGFLLDHRHHHVRGRIAASLRRELHAEGVETPYVMELNNRGFLYELDPPVPVEVLRGNVRGQQRPSTGFFPLPEQLQAQAAEQLAADPGTQ